jgi:hypothetical protein
MRFGMSSAVVAPVMASMGHYERRGAEADWGGYQEAVGGVSEEEGGERRMTAGGGHLWYDATGDGVRILRTPNLGTRSALRCQDVTGDFKRSLVRPASGVWAWRNSLHLSVLRFTISTCPVYWS